MKNKFEELIQKKYESLNEATPTSYASQQPATAQQGTAQQGTAQQGTAQQTDTQQGQQQGQQQQGSNDLALDAINYFVKLGPQQGIKELSRAMQTINKSPEGNKFLQALNQQKQQGQQTQQNQQQAGTPTATTVASVANP